MHQSHAEPRLSLSRLRQRPVRSRATKSAYNPLRVQDRYAFDVGDFGKLGLLRHIHRTTGLRIGVLWWRTALGTSGNDGKHVGYLQNPAYRACDPELWEEMRRRFNPAARAIEALEPLLPPNTRFFGAPVPSLPQRPAWLKEALANMQDSALVFCDPDNGLAIKEPCRSLRHVAVSELRLLYGRGHSLVVYHTPNRSKPHDAQIEDTLERLPEAIPGLGPSWAARFRCGSSRVFFVLPQPTHARALDEAMVQMRSTAWIEHRRFELLRRDQLTSTSA